MLVDYTSKPQILLGKKGKLAKKTEKCHYIGRYLQI
jgi:hypothetical protein